MCAATVVTLCFVLRKFALELHRSAFKHGLDATRITHALSHLLVSFDLEPDADPPRVLGIGVDSSGNFLELVWLELDDSQLLIHAMPLRRKYYDLLPSGIDTHDKEVQPD